MRVVFQRMSSDEESAPLLPGPSATNKSISGHDRDSNG
jgi:hypothetical protein